VRHDLNGETQQIQLVVFVQPIDNQFMEMVMAISEFTLSTQQGSFDLSASVRLIGEDLLVAIWGGEKPHIGAVAMAHPRPSLKNPAATSATASVFCYVGHKEDQLAKAAAEVLAAALNTRVVVTAGIHWDNIKKEEIQRVIANSEILVDAILKRIVSDVAFLLKNDM
jgi:hypothetical protein